MKADVADMTAKKGSLARAAALLLMMSPLALGGCEDVITPIIEEDVRLAELPEYTLTILPPAAGSVTPSGEQSLKQSQALSVTAVAPEGYVFINWEVSEGAGSVAFGDSESSATTVSLSSGDAVIQPMITNTPRVLTVGSDGHGTTSPSGAVAVANGQARSLVAAADAAQGYEFDAWVQTGGEGTASFGDAGSANTTVTVSGGDASIEARFRLKQYTISVTNDGHGTTVPAAAIVVTHGVASATIQATPSSGYSFFNWTGPAGVVFANANAASTTFTATAGNATIRANFQGLSYTLTLNASGPGGVTSPATPTASVTHGVALSITASNPSSGGYYFSGWTKTAGAGTATFADAASRTTTVTVTNGNATITANYSQISANLTRRGQLKLEDASYVTSQRIDVVRDVLYDGGFAYVAGSFGGSAKVVKIDVSNPASPTFDSSISFATGQAYELIKDGSYLDIGVVGTGGDRYRSLLKSTSGLNPVSDMGYNFDVEQLAGDGWVSANNVMYAYGVQGSLDVGSDDPIEDILFIPAFNYLYVTRSAGMSNDGYAEVYYSDGDQVLLESSSPVADNSPGEMVFNGSEYVYAASGSSGIITLNVDYDYFDDIDVILPNANTGQPVMAAIAGNYLVSIGSAATDRLAVFDIHYENGSAGNPYYLSGINRYAQGVIAIDAHGSYVYAIEGAYLVIYELVANVQ